MAKRKKTYDQEAEKLLNQIKDGIAKIKEEYPNVYESNTFNVYLYLSDKDARAINKYINWTHIKSDYKIGTMSKLSTEFAKIIVMQAPNIKEAHIKTEPTSGLKAELKIYPYADKKPTSYEEALENVRELAGEAYKAMLPGSKQEE